MEHERALIRQDRLTTAQELAIPHGAMAGVPLVTKVLSAGNTRSGREEPYLQYASQGGGLRGYTNRFTKLPVNTTYGNLLDGVSTNQYIEVQLPHNLSMLKDVFMEMDVTFTDGSGGTNSLTVAPTDQWVDRIELRGGGAGTGVVDQMDGDTVLLERAHRLSDVEVAQSSLDLGWGNVDASEYRPAASTAAGTQATALTDVFGALQRKFQIQIPNFLSDAKVYVPALRLNSRDMYLRIYMKPSPFSLDLHGLSSGTVATATVNSVRFWFHEHILNGADAALMRQRISAQPIAFRGVSRAYYKRSKGTLDDDTPYSELLSNLRGYSLGYMFYLKEDSTATQLAAASTSSPNGELAHFHAPAVARLENEQSAPIVEEETEEMNFACVQAKHVTHPWFKPRAGSIWRRWLFPFCDNFAAALRGVHTGGRQMTGQETLYYTTSSTATKNPDAAASIIVISYNAATLVCQPAAAPELQVAQSA